MIIAWITSPQALAQGAKQLTQTIRGVVFDKSSGESLPLATVGVEDSSIKVTANETGLFVLPNVPIGRHSVIVSFVGYETSVVKEILVTSAK